MKSPLYLCLSVRNIIRLIDNMTTLHNTMFVVFIVLIVLLCEQRIVFSKCLLRLGVLRVLCYYVCLFYTGHFSMVPLHLTCLHCLQHANFNISSIYIINLSFQYVY